MEEAFAPLLREELLHRLYMVVEHVKAFWMHNPHQHFTYHGLEHARQIQQRLVELLGAWNRTNPLSQDELFILFAASLLFDIGMQCTNLQKIHIDWHPGDQLTPAQLEKVRQNKHILTCQMIKESVGESPHRLHLGLLELDDYTRRIMDVCLGCSDEPFVAGQERVAVRNNVVRVSVLVALLRLADQLSIDKARVSLDLLARAPLKPEKKLRWWLYHYTQTLSLEDGRIPFRYSLLPAYQRLLGQIRTVMEKPFTFTVNKELQYLWKDLTLVTREKPFVEDVSHLDRVYEIPTDLILELSNTKVDGAYAEDKRLEERENRCLLVLDYENFLFQLGLEGYFFTQDDLLDNLLPDMLIAARDQYFGLVDGFAFAHWDRPDLHPIKAMLDGMYELNTLDGEEESTEAIRQKLNNLSEHGSLPRQVLLIAPPRGLVSTARQFQEKGQAIEAWIPDTREAKIFPARINKTQFLSQVLGLAGVQRRTQESLDMATTSCILRLDEKLLSNKEGLSFEAVNSLLAQVEAIQGQHEWWRLYLIQQKMLSFEQTDRDSRYLLKLHREHGMVEAVLKKRLAVITVFQKLAPDGGRVDQDRLFAEVERHLMFNQTGEQPEQFLKVLQEENIIFVDPHTGMEDDLPLWQLNGLHVVVMMYNADRYLPLFVLGLDHALTQYGHQALYEHTLNRHLEKYMGNSSLIEPTYQLALSKGWIKKQTWARKQRYRTDSVEVIEPDYHHEGVQEVIVNCDILIKILYATTKHDFVQRDHLWRKLSSIARFTLKREEFDQWLMVFEDTAVISIKKHEEGRGRDGIMLRCDSSLTQHLFGRLNMPGVVLAMRTLRAKSEEMAVPAEKIVGRISYLSTHNDRMLAVWAIAHAKLVKVVKVKGMSAQGAENSGPLALDEQALLFIDEEHSKVRRLVGREKAACRALADLLRRLSRPDLNDGWVPYHIVLQRMESNPLFGTSYEEYDYWINNAIHKYDLLRDRPDPQRRFEKLLQAKSS